MEGSGNLGWGAALDYEGAQGPIELLLVFLLLLQVGTDVLIPAKRKYTFNIFLPTHTVIYSCNL